MRLRKLSRKSVLGVMLSRYPMMLHGGEVERGFETVGRELRKRCSLAISSRKIQSWGERGVLRCFSRWRFFGPQPNTERTRENMLEATRVLAYPGGAVPSTPHGSTTLVSGTAWKTPFFTPIPLPSPLFFSSPCLCEPSRSQSARTLWSRGPPLHLSLSPTHSPASLNMTSFPTARDSLWVPPTGPALVLS